MKRSYLKNEIDDCLHGGLSSANNKYVKVDFSSNVNPLGASKNVLKVIKEKLDNLVSIYPDPKQDNICKKISDYFDNKINPENISVGNGATELIHNFMSIQKNSNVVIPIPSFCEYELACSRNNSKITYVPLNSDFQIDSDEIVKKARKSELVFLCNPNNPTGLLSTKAIEDILNRIKESTIVFLDECFIELVSNYGKSNIVPDLIKSGNRNSMTKYINDFNNLIILRSLTKAHGLAGLRFGYMISNEKIAKTMKRNQISWNINGLAQMGAIIALDDILHIKKALNIIIQEKKTLHDGINKGMKSMTAFNSDSNFFLIKLQNLSSTFIKNYLLEKFGILIRDCNTFRGLNKEYIRVSVRTSNENSMLLKALHKVDKIDNK